MSGELERNNDPRHGLPRKLPGEETQPSAKGIGRIADSIGRALEREDVQDRLVNAGISVLEKNLGISGSQHKKPQKTRLQQFGAGLMSLIPMIVLLFVLAVLWRLVTHYIP